MTSFLILLVRAYRAALAPFFGPCCRFEPSCSRYAEEALRRHGVMKGLRLTLFLRVRCHPLCAGGRDPVPIESGRW